MCTETVLHLLHMRDVTERLFVFPQNKNKRNYLQKQQEK